MSLATESYLSTIGETAGAVWHVLDCQGEMTLAKLVKDVDLPRDLVMQALGWLAREDKITIDDSRSRKVALRTE